MHEDEPRSFLGPDFVVSLGGRPPPLFFFPLLLLSLVLVFFFSFRSESD